MGFMYLVSLSFDMEYETSSERLWGFRVSVSPDRYSCVGGWLTFSY